MQRNDDEVSEQEEAGFEVWVSLPADIVELISRGRNDDALVIPPLDSPHNSTRGPRFGPRMVCLARWQAIPLGLQLHPNVSSRPV